MRRRRAAVVFNVFFFLIIAIVGFGEAVLHLWNWLMPTIFGLTAITFWQAVGLLALSWLLFGGWRGMHGASFSSGKLRRRLKERWERMTPEERSRFREGVRGPWGQGLRN